MGRIHDNAPTLVCPYCGDTMKHVRTIPKLGVRPERLVFVCPSCKEIETKEVRQVAQVARLAALSIE
jgi:predicted RNA-binding Zn-ribbon protein involved in translation (DUF1610 family)